MFNYTLWYRIKYRYRKMEAMSYTAARANLAKTMKKVCDDHAPVIITRKSESPVVMMSLDDYEAMQETTYLLRSPANARALIESIAELEAGNGTPRELLE
jgi:antitoxin YefM